jgi:hypothetical protein
MTRARRTENAPCSENRLQQRHTIRIMKKRILLGSPASLLLSVLKVVVVVLAGFGGCLGTGAGEGGGGGGAHDDDAGGAELLTSRGEFAGECAADGRGCRSCDASIILEPNSCVTFTRGQPFTCRAAVSWQDQCAGTGTTVQLWLRGQQVAEWEASDPGGWESVDLPGVYMEDNHVSLRLISGGGNVQQEVFASNFSVVFNTVSPLEIEWPPPGYTFKRMGYGPKSFWPFIRVRKFEAGDLCIELEGQGVQVYHKGQFCSFSGIADGEYVVDVANCAMSPTFAPEHEGRGETRLTEMQRVHFFVDSTIDYEEDGTPDGLPSAGVQIHTCHAPDTHAGVECDPRECGSRGRCDPGGSGACVCDPDWIGEACDHSLLDGTRFLPGSDPREKAALSLGGCIRERDADGLAEELDALLDSLDGGRGAGGGGGSEAEGYYHLSLNETSGFGVTLHLIAQV